MSEYYLIKETVYCDQDPESYFSEIQPAKFGSPAFVHFTYLDEAKKFKSKEEAHKILKSSEFEHHKCEVVTFTEETKKLKKGFYLDGPKIKFHYIPKSMVLNGRGEFCTEDLLERLITEVRNEIEKEVEDVRANFSWAHDIDAQIEKRKSAVLKKYGV